MYRDQEHRACWRNTSRLASEPWLWSLQGGVRTWDVTQRAGLAAVGRDRQTTLPTGTADTCLGLWEKLLTCVEPTAQEASPADRD